MSVAQFCCRCRETLTDDQVECPFCGQATTPIDELVCGHCGRSDKGVQTFVCGKGGCPLGGDL